MRVYVPYGAQWYGYLMRRLAETPANLPFFVRALIVERLTHVDTIAILGGGKIGEALLSGLLRGERTADDIVVAEKHPRSRGLPRRDVRRPGAGRRRSAAAHARAP